VSVDYSMHRDFPPQLWSLVQMIRKGPVPCNIPLQLYNCTLHMPLFQHHLKRTFLYEQESAQFLPRHRPAFLLLDVKGK
jgi:hypothetical protein